MEAFNKFKTILEYVANSKNRLSSGTIGVDDVWSYIASLPEVERIKLAREIMASAIPPEEFYLIPSFEERTTAPMNTWIMQNEQMDFCLPEGARVLDIGSGGWPFKNATHLADLFPNETSHRKEQLALDDRPFDVVDIQSLPYDDHAFDFVFCSHVLEHLDNPGKAIRELNRIAPRGYVEVPTRTSDIMFNFTGMKDHHKWHGLNLNGTLALIEWTVMDRREQASNIFWQMAQSKYHNSFQEYLEHSWDFFFVRIEWTKRLPFIVLSGNGEIIDKG